MIFEALYCAILGMHPIEDVKKHFLSIGSGSGINLPYWNRVGHWRLTYGSDVRFWR